MGTAGPSEIVAAAIMENARGDVVGDKTFGSGSIQKVIEMPDGRALMLSVAKYYSPSGKALQDTCDHAEHPGGGQHRRLPGSRRGRERAARREAAGEGKESAPDDQLKRAIDVLKNPAQKAA